MEFLKESKLIANTKIRDTSKRITASTERFSYYQGDIRKTAFLSHSHYDNTIAKGLSTELKNQGISLYLDWDDTTMPKNTSRETAEKIKKKIKECDFFLILATQNALKSRWVPWEIGIADSIKHINKIGIIPIVKDDGSFSGNEYLQIYHHIHVGQNNNLFVIEPNETKSILLENWIK